MNKRLRLAYDFLSEAKEELERYKKKEREALLRQACEKGWGAVVQALKAVDPKIRKHADFGRTAVRLAEEYNNEDIVQKEACGEALHSFGFYEGGLDTKQVEHYLIAVEELLGIIETILNGKEAKK